MNNGQPHPLRTRETHGQFIQLTVDGLTLGSVYALIALWLHVRIRVLKCCNSPHGDVFMVGTFIGSGGACRACSGTATRCATCGCDPRESTLRALAGTAGTQGVVIPSSFPYHDRCATRSDALRDSAWCVSSSSPTRASAVRARPRTTTPLA